MVKGAFQPKIQVLEDHLDRPVPFSADPHIGLLERGEITQEAQGIFALGPLLTRLIAYFEGRFLELAESFGANPYRFPTLIPARYLERVNYFHAFPHSLTFATHLREDLDVIDHFAQHAACDEHGLNTPPESFSAIQTLLSPAVCYHLYFALADQPLPGGKLVATAVGNCFRYEVDQPDLSGAPVELHHARGDLRRRRRTSSWRTARPPASACARYSKRSGWLTGWKAPTIPSSSASSASRPPSRAPSSSSSRSAPACRSKTSTLAVGSYNYHQDFFGRNLNITLPDGSPAHTGCVAFGLERMAFAFLAQYGLEPEDWPAAVREAV